MKVISFFLLLLLYTHGAVACVPFSKDGEFMREDFSKYLEKYRTDLPGQPKGLVGVVVNRALKEIDFIWNFHEGDIARYADKDCVLIRSDQKRELPKYSYQFISENSFFINDDANNTYKFIGVKSFEEMINKNLIAGKFLSADGSAYRFTDSGELDIAGQTYGYRLVIDRNEFDADLLVVETNPTSIMKFQWFYGNLYLYKLNELTGEFERSAVILVPIEE